MPVLFVYGVPESVKEDELSRICEDLRVIVTSVKALGVTKDQVSVFFPPDRLKEGLGEEIIVFLKGLFNLPERTKEVRKVLAKVVVATIRSNFPNTKLIECFVEPFDPDSGFAGT